MLFEWLPEHSSHIDIFVIFAVAAVSPSFSLFLAGNLIGCPRRAGRRPIGYTGNQKGDSIPKRCKGVHCVDFGESFPTSIYLQNLASTEH